MHLSLLTLTLLLKESFAATVKCPKLDISKYIAKSTADCTLQKYLIVTSSSTVPTTSEDSSQTLCLPMSVIEALLDLGCMSAPLYAQLNRACTALHIYDSNGQSMLACSQCIAGSYLNTDSKFCVSKDFDLCSNGTQWNNDKLYCPPKHLAANAVPDPTGVQYVCANGYEPDFSKKPNSCVKKQTPVVPPKSVNCTCNNPNSSSNTGFTCTDNTSGTCPAGLVCGSIKPFLPNETSTVCVFGV